MMSYNIESMRFEISDLSFSDDFLSNGKRSDRINEIDQFITVYDLSSIIFSYDSGDSTRIQVVFKSNDDIIFITNFEWRYDTLFQLCDNKIGTWYERVTKKPSSHNMKRGSIINLNIIFNYIKSSTFITDFDIYSQINISTPIPRSEQKTYQSHVIKTRKLLGFPANDTIQKRVKLRI